MSQRYTLEYYKREKLKLDSTNRVNNRDITLQ
jgi:hypothetical protein